MSDESKAAIENGDAVGTKGPLLEYSVVYTDRAYNLMSAPFCAAMREINDNLKEACVTWVS